MKKRIGLLLIIVLVIGITGCEKKEKKQNNNAIKNDVVTITSTGVTKEQNLDGLKISNVSMIVNEGITSFNAKVTNETDEDITVEEIKINVKDKDGNLIAELSGYVGGIVKSKETKEIVNTADADLSKAYEITYTK